MYPYGRRASCSFADLVATKAKEEYLRRRPLQHRQTVPGQSLQSTCWTCWQTSSAETNSTDLEWLDFVAGSVSSMSEVLASFLALRDNEPASAKTLGTKLAVLNTVLSQLGNRIFTISNKLNGMVLHGPVESLFLKCIHHGCHGANFCPKELYVVSFGVGTKFLKEAASWTLQNHSQYDLQYMDKIGIDFR